MPDTIERIRPTGADAAPSTIEGRIDKVEGGRLYGWAWDRLRPADRLEVTAFLGERRLGTALANRVRDDLRLNGIGDGLYAFEIEIGDDADGASGGAVPGGIQVQARSPATGAAELLERHAPEPEVRADVLLTPLSRILAGVDRLAAAQRQIHGIQQGQFKGLGELIRQGHATADWKALEEAVAGVRETQKTMEDRMAVFEVFQTRFDQMLADLDTRLARAGAVPERNRPGWIGAGVLLTCLASLAGLGIVVAGLLHLSL